MPQGKKMEKVPARLGGHLRQAWERDVPMPGKQQGARQGPLRDDCIRMCIMCIMMWPCASDNYGLMMPDML